MHKKDKIYGMFMKKEWQILKPDIQTVRMLSATLKCNPIIATILVNRKIIFAKDAFCFVESSLNNIRPPFSMKEMDIAVKRIYTAIKNNEKILIFGDYDVDGIAATSILLDFFNDTGADISYYIPHRIKEGYGFQVDHVLNCALPSKTNLVITADCGVSSHDAVKAAQKVGIDVIITDHHKVSEKLPDAIAVVNPKRHDCNSDFDDLSGVGVAFYLLISLRKHLRDMNFWHDRPEPNLKSICDLVALGTVADKVPIINENRILTKAGLEIINSGSRPGINALIKISGINSPFVDTDDIAFRLAPRLNAAGRIDHAKIAVELLTTKDIETARRIAQSLNKMNITRQKAENNLLEEIEEYLKENQYLLKQNSLVLANPAWNEGVLGIVASRLVDRYFCPVILISVKNSIGKGSARSIPGFDMYRGLSACAEVLESFGGHSMAAGLTIKTQETDRFRNNFSNIVQEMTTPDTFVPKIFIDCMLGFDEISDELMDELEILKPFGPKNPEPLFIARDIKVLSSKIVGGNHRRMILTQQSDKTGKTFAAIHFNIETGIPLKETFERVAFRLRWNHWNGNRTPQIVIEEI